ncbi:MAG: cell division protein ZapA [Oscillospiraceae bacterium]
MQNKVSIYVQGKKYNIITDESKEYVIGLSHVLDENLQKILDLGQEVSLTTALVLSGISSLDDAYKADITAKNFREEIKKYIERELNTDRDLKKEKEKNRHLENKLEDLSRQINNLKNQK